MVVVETARRVLVLLVSVIVGPSVASKLPVPVCNPMMISFGGSQSAWTRRGLDVLTTVPQPENDPVTLCSVPDVTNETDPPN